jgi:hypothetical protein
VLDLALPFLVQHQAPAIAWPWFSPIGLATAWIFAKLLAIGDPARGAAAPGPTRAPTGRP